MDTSQADPLLQVEQESLLEHVLAAFVRVRRRAWVVVTAIIVGGGAGVWWAAQQPRRYEAKVSLLIDSGPPRVLPNVPDVIPEAQMGDRDRFVNSQIRLLESQAMSNEVEDALHEPRGSLAGSITAVPDRYSYALELSVSDVDGERAKRVVKGFADAFMQMSVQDRVGTVQDAAHFLENEAQQHQSLLERDERALYDFNRKNELPGSNFEESHKIASSTLSALHIDAATAQAAGIKLRAQLTEIEAAADDPALQRALLSRDEASSNGASQRWALLNEQLKQLELRYGPQHPRLVDTRAALDEVNKEIAAQTRTALAEVRAKLHANEQEQELLHNAIAEETRKAVTLRAKELDYSRLKRQLDHDVEVYGMLARREKETELQTITKQSYVRWLEGPNAAAPVSRNFPRAILLGILLGLCAGAALAYLIDLLDDTIKSPFEGERELKPALLGMMMNVPVEASLGDSPDRARAEYLLRHPRSIVSEQCHTLTTQLYSLFLDGPPRALMVVSSAMEDGKTLTSINLALTVAARGKKVCLVDADLRRGRLHKVFQLPAGDGLFELVTQTIGEDAATRRTWVPNVDVVTTGEVPEKLSPQRVFEHPELGRVIERLKARYDLVVIDTSPVPIVSDALLLANHVDGALGVARAGKTSGKLARKLADQLRAGRVNLLGWVLNDVAEAELKSKYYYRYGYGRAYGYYAEPTRKSSA